MKTKPVFEMTGEEFCLYGYHKRVPVEEALHGRSALGKVHFLKEVIAFKRGSPSHVNTEDIIADILFQIALEVERLGDIDYGHL